MGRSRFEGSSTFERGHHGDTDLSGLRTAAIYQWLGAIHEGNGQMQLVIDTAANDTQAAALERIRTGQDTDEMKTFWFVYAKMSPTKYPTLRKPIDLTLDMGALFGKATLAVSGGMLILSGTAVLLTG